MSTNFRKTAKYLIWSRLAVLGSLHVYIRTDGAIIRAPQVANGLKGHSVRFPSLRCDLINLTSRLFVVPVWKPSYDENSLIRLMQVKEIMERSCAVSRGSSRTPVCVCVCEVCQSVTPRSTHNNKQYALCLAFTSRWIKSKERHNVA
jgi:hypothetical protein